jgi:hypothetical protein
MVGLGVVAIAVATAASAVTCTVPSASHPDIQTAISDIGCTEIILAAQTFAESPAIARSLTLRGAGSSQTFIQGTVEISDGAVSLEGLHLASAAGALDVHSGAEVSGFDLMTIADGFETPLFADGFESGDLTSWSTWTP